MAGYGFRIRLITPPDRQSTTVSATDMVIAVDKVVVTARAEQMPNICRVIGLLPISGRTR
jgi:hypothetical protein